MKLPWYMKSIKNGTEIKIHWAWIYYQTIKTHLRQIFNVQKK